MSRALRSRDQRSPAFSLRRHLLLDYSKNRVTDETMPLLRALERKKKRDAASRPCARCARATINLTRRAVLHVALSQPPNRPSSSTARRHARRQCALPHESFSDAVALAPGRLPGAPSADSSNIGSVSLLLARPVPEWLFAPYARPGVDPSCTSSRTSTSRTSPRSSSASMPETTAVPRAVEDLPRRREHTTGTRARTWFLEHAKTRSTSP